MTLITIAASDDLLALLVDSVTINTTLSGGYLLVELHQRPGQLVRPPRAGPGRLVAQAVLQHRLQVRRVDGLQLLPVWIAAGTAARTDGGRREVIEGGQGGQRTQTYT